MLCNISYCPQPPSSEVTRPPLEMENLLSVLRNHFSCVDPVTEYAVRFRQGNTQGIIFDSGYAEMAAPEQDVETFSKCVRLLTNILYRKTVTLRRFDAFIGKSPLSSASLELYKSIARLLNMKWHINQKALGPLFTARTEETEDTYV
jgi:hypothetical protein